LGQAAPPLSVVTARPVKEPVELWFEKHVPGLVPDCLNIIATSVSTAKLEILKSLGTRFFVEDRIDTCHLIAAHGITPRSIVKGIDEVLTSVYERDYLDYTRISEDKDVYLSPTKRKKRMDELTKLMKEASAALEFEKAAACRDELIKLKKRELELGL
ncbi:MAG TPA: UvrB/UvrC motif-containing protein, partial [Candidatus Aminicenantes bacterium]|nr:UvrB/UvrC motif-containing protein [Candidatus Aminicenantes bacterium]